MIPNISNDRTTLSPAIRAVLDALRVRIRRYVWLEGIAAAMVWLGIAFWGTLVIDWFFEPSTTIRIGILSTVLVVLFAILTYWIGRRIGVRISDGNLATLLERRFPEFNDTLLTAVSLSAANQTNYDADSPEIAVIGHEMLHRTCREAETHLVGVNVHRVFDYRPLYRSIMAACLLILGIAFFAAVTPHSFAVWAKRSLGLSNDLWPRNTRLEVVGFPNGVRKVARGADFELQAGADTSMPHVPQVVEVRYRTEGGGRGRATMDRRGIAHLPEDKYQDFTYTFRSILTDVQFDVVGGDDRVAGLRLEAVDSPTVSEMTLDCELPSYIGRQQAPLPVTGVMQAPMGSRLTVHAKAANKDLARIEINRIVGDHPMPACVLEDNAIAADRRGFTFSLDPLMQETTLLFTLTDTDGIRSRDPIRLSLSPISDTAPQMAVQLDGIGTSITLNARIPVTGRIADDYGIAKTWFDYGITDVKQGEQPIALAADHPTETILDNAAMDLEPLALEVGQKLLLSVKAVDLCDLGEGSNVSVSERWTLDVVSAEQLRAILDARELVLRQRFDRMIQEMTETRDILARLTFAIPEATDARNSDTANTADDGPERQQALRGLRVDGALTNCRKSTQEVVGLAESFDDIRKQLVNNRIDTEELLTRLQSGIAAPLREIADPMFPELEKRLDALRAVLDNREKGPEARDLAQQQADAILLAMQKVRDRMLDLEGFNEAVDLLRSIITLQDQLREQTQQRQKQKIRDLLKD